VQRRPFLIRLAQTFVAPLAAPLVARADSAPAATTPTTPPVPLHLQDCRIAGSHHYECHKLLGHLAVGDRVELRAQPANPHDRRAIEAYWHGRKLGYLPRRDNGAAASLLARGHALDAEIIGVDDPAEEWEPVRLRVWVAIIGGTTHLHPPVSAIVSKDQSLEFSRHVVSGRTLCDVIIAVGKGTVQ
jgi:hypothetical protein